MSYLDTMRAIWPDHQARSSLYNKISSVQLCVTARQLALIDEHHRDVTTLRRMETKMVEISRLYTDSFWTSADGEEWLKANWPAIVELSVQGIKEWVRQHNPRAKR